MSAALALYPCDLIFIHRDAERQPPDLRRSEIVRALQEVENSDAQRPPAICVIPVRMQKAWLLFDELAIRKAAVEANRQGHGGIKLVSQITGLDEKTIHRGQEELSLDVANRPPDRIRLCGAGGPSAKKRCKGSRETTGGGRAGSGWQSRNGPALGVPKP